MVAAAHRPPQGVAATGAGRIVGASRRRPPRRTAAPLVAAALVAAACGSGAAPGASPGPGVVFGYPVDGQWDVPLRARLLLALSAAPPTPVDTTCSRSSGHVTGSFCVEGPAGFVPGALTVEGSTLAFLPAGGLEAGTTYRVWARPALLPGATNLPADAPLLTFHTRSTRTRPGAATVVTVNGAPLAADGTSPQPFHDVAPVRLVFSEPLDGRTVGAGTVRLVHVADGRLVDGVVAAGGIHLTFDPAEALGAGHAYRLEVDAAVRDLGGEPIAPVALTFAPAPSAAPGQGLHPLPMAVAPPYARGATQPRSRIGAMPVNAYAMSSLLDGDATGGILAGGLDARAGDPAGGPTIPVVVPRGERLDLTPMPIRTGGVGAGVSTGTIHLSLLTDASGLMRRSPFRPPELAPDDAQSPTFVDLTLDAAISSDDPVGNAISTRTIMGIRAIGIATADGDQLALELVAAIDYDVLGLEAAPIGLALRLRTGARAPAAPPLVPVLAASSPPDGARGVPPGDALELVFSGPLEPAVRDGADVLLQRSGGAAVPATIRVEGGAVTIVPARRLDEGATYTLVWIGLRALSGASLPSGALSFTTEVSAASPAVAPIVLAVHPGAPCALAGGTARAPGRCAGGRATDSGYLPFTLAANHDVRAWFSLPVEPRSLTLGTACGRGSVRVEQVGAGGRCTGVVPGTLVKVDRALRFVPASPWTPGAAYRLALVAGADATCDAGEICGAGGLPLNTDPLTGIANGAGGPDLVIDFTGAPASAAVLLPLASDRVADANGNGYLDGDEAADDRSRGAYEVSGVDGPLLLSATMDGPDCSGRPGPQACAYTTAAVPALVRGVLDRCPVDPQGRSAAMPYPCVEVQAVPHVLLQTSVSLTTRSLVGTTHDASTGEQLIRAREPGRPILGYIFEEPGAPDPQLLLAEEAYLDAPDMVLQAGATHDLHSKPLRLTLKGPVTHRPDGRTQVTLRNLADATVPVTLTVHLGPLPITGTIHVRAPAGAQRLGLAGPPAR